MSRHEPEVIELSDDDDDGVEKEQTVLQSSHVGLRDHEGCQLSKPTSAGPQHRIPAAEVAKSESRPSNKPGLTTFGGLCLDRKKMEAERLARLGKKRQMSHEPGKEPPARRVKLGQETRDDTTCNGEESATDSGSSQPIMGPRFATGSVKRTWAFGHARCGDDIKIEEVFQKGELELAVLASYQWDDEWLLSKLDLSKTKLLCVAYAHDEAQKEQMRANVPSDRVKFCFPQVDGAGRMHAKVQLLKFPGYLRIVVPSGNLTSHDWGETGLLENLVFLIDLPLRLADDSGLGPQQTDFGVELRRFLFALGLETKLVLSLDKYDFTATQPYAFVHSICGTHRNDDWQFTGHCGLGRAIQGLGLATESPVEVDFVCSSLGNLKPDLLIGLYRAFQGHGGKDLLGKRDQSRKARGQPVLKTDSDTGSPLPDKFRFYYPSQETVANSRGGKGSAGTICFHSSWWNSATFPRNAWRDCVCRRQGLLIHTKAAFVRPVRLGRICLAWAYIGSANLSESAWGRLATERGSAKPKITCRNWECGVVVKSRETTSNDLESLFDGVIPLPMKVSGAPSSSAVPSAHLPWFSN